jgi:hypothetical protein
MDMSADDEKLQNFLKEQQAKGAFASSLGLQYPFPVPPGMSEAALNELLASLFSPDNKMAPMTSLNCANVFAPIMEESEVDLVDPDERPVTNR